MNDINNQLLESQADFLEKHVGFDAVGARKTAEEMLAAVIEECKKDGTYYLYKNLGSAILDNLPIADEYSRMIANSLKETLPWKRETGVTNEDIRWWLDMHEIERRMMSKTSDIAQIMLFQELTERKGMTSKDAMHEVRKYHPQYSHNEENEFMKGEDRPLPPELRDRVNKYILRRASLDYRQYESDLAESSSFNALVRKEIKNKNL